MSLFDPTILAGGLEEVQKNFKALNQQLQEAELKKLQIYQNLPEGFVPEFTQGPLGNTEVRIHNMGIKDPRVQLKITLAEKQAALESQAHQEAFERGLIRERINDAEQLKQKTTQIAAGEVTQLNQRLEALKDSPTARQQLLRTAIPRFSQHARTLGSAQAIPGLGALVGQYADDIAAVTQPAQNVGTPTQQPTNRAPESGIALQPTLEQAGLVTTGPMPAPTAPVPTPKSVAKPTSGKTPQDQLLSTTSGRQSLQIAAEAGLVGQKAQKFALDQTLDTFYRAQNPEISPAELAAKKDTILNSKVDDYTRLLKEQGAGEEMGRQLAVEVADIVNTQAGTNASPLVTGTVVTGEPKKEGGPAPTATVIIDGNPDLSGDAQAIPDLIDAVDQVAQKRSGGVLSAEDARDMARKALKPAIQGIGRVLEDGKETTRPGLRGQLLTRLERLGGLKDGKPQVLGDHILVVRPRGEIRVNEGTNQIEIMPKFGRFQTQERLVQKFLSGRLIGGLLDIPAEAPGEGGNTIQGITNLARGLNFTNDLRIDTVRLILRPDQLKALPAEDRKLLGETKVAGIYEVPVRG